MYKNIIDQESFAQKVKNIQSIFADYEYPKTPQEYWSVVDKYWIHLLNIILRFGPDTVEVNGEIVKLAVAASRLKEARSPDLVNYFHDSWVSAPDDGCIHAIPAWGILRDLCSESYLVQDF